jgi:hypothetical protein
MTGYFNPSVDVYPEVDVNIPGQIACASGAFSGGQGFESYDIQFGEATGTVQLTYDAFSVPDRFVVKWNGNVVIDTGYVGDSSYDAALAALGLPAVTGPGAGTASFNKNLASPGFATVEVYGPLEGTAWEFTLGCPDDAEPPEVDPTPPSVQTFAGADIAKTFLDSCIVYTGAATTTITGLDHLEGMEVQVLADGATHPNRTVEGGVITLEAESQIVHVGLPYESIIQPMRLDLDDAAGNTQGAVKNIRGVTLRLMDTLGLKISDLNGDTFRRLEFRSTEDEMDAAPPLFSGDKHHEVDGEFDNDATIILKQDQPLPWTLLGMVVHYQVTGQP